MLKINSKLQTKLDASWVGFAGSDWKTEVNVRDFIQANYTPYEGDESFLAKASESTNILWEKVMVGIKQENATHAPVDYDTDVISTLTSHKAGYINKDLETIVGLQTEAPLKRAIIPNGGISMVKAACAEFASKAEKGIANKEENINESLAGKYLSKTIENIYTKHRKTHNAGVFQVYTPAIRECRTTGILTGLPDAYCRGRIIGDYRRVAVYGIDFLMADKLAQHASLEADLTSGTNLEDNLRLREEINDQWNSLKDMKQMAAEYGCDISGPAVTAQEAIQATYFGYLAAIKSTNGAAMSFGRTASFLDIYIEKDLKSGLITEEQAQELVDHLIMKLRMVRFLRTSEYDALFSGDPIWATECLAGMGLDGRTLVTKNSFRYLNTMYTMGPSPEPNMTVLWSESLPQAFKEYCAKVSIDTSSIQYENDDLMRPDMSSDDYSIACCVSPMVIGKQMQFFGARANFAKALLFAMNGGVNEKSIAKDSVNDEARFRKVTPNIEPMTAEVLDYDEVYAKYDLVLEWLADQYMTALNCIHYMHDKHCYESALMALHDRDVHRTMAAGIAGLSIAADSLSAIKYAKVKPVRKEVTLRGTEEKVSITDHFEIEGDFPKFGNNDARVDDIACELVENFMKKLRARKTYRNATPTQSILTITSNIVYGKKTGDTPDGRLAGAPFAPGANPMHGRDEKGAVASLTSVAKLPFEYAQDGISYTFSIVPKALGKEAKSQKVNLAGLMDGYFAHRTGHEGGQHLNINVMDREMLLDAVKHPENYPQLTIRVSGYAVRFNSLNAEQKAEVISRTFTAGM